MMSPEMMAEMRKKHASVRTSDKEAVIETETEPAPVVVKRLQPVATAKSASGETASRLPEKPAVLEGWLHKQGGASGALFSRSSWRKRWIVADGKRLVWRETPQGAPKGEVSLCGNPPIDVDPQDVDKSHEFVFCVRTPERHLFAKCQNADEQRRWVAGLRAMTEYASGRSSVPASSRSTMAASVRTIGGSALGRASAAPTSGRSTGVSVSGRSFGGSSVGGDSGRPEVPDNVTHVTPTRAAGPAKRKPRTTVRGSVRPGASPAAAPPAVALD